MLLASPGAAGLRLGLVLKLVGLPWNRSVQNELIVTGLFGTPVSESWNWKTPSPFGGPVLELNGAAGVVPVSWKMTGTEPKGAPGVRVTVTVGAVAGSSETSDDTWMVL